VAFVILRFCGCNFSVLRSAAIFILKRRCDQMSRAVAAGVELAMWFLDRSAIT
jgi:hypothetical protein